MKAPQDDHLAIVLGQRQLVAVCCMFLVVLGLVATLAYVSGRSITAAQMAAAQESREVPRPLVVEPQAVVAPLQAQAQVLPTPTPAPVPTPAPATSSAPFSSALTDPQKGGAYWQVGVVDRGIGAVFVEHLARLGLRATMSGTQTPNMYKVMVGPLADGNETAAVKRTLDANGFQSFLRRF